MIMFRQPSTALVRMNETPFHVVLIALLKMERDEARRREMERHQFRVTFWGAHYYRFPMRPWLVIALA